MGKWVTEELGDCLEALIDYRGKSPPKAATGIPVLSAKVVKTGGLVRPVEQTIAIDFYPKWMTRGLPQQGDIVMTTEAPMGEVIQLDAETAQFALGQRIVCLRGKQGKLDNKFLRYTLISSEQQSVLAAYATGTTVLGISQKALRTVPISFPAYSEQVQIGELLSALDDKIELNRRMNATLEASARAVFRDWFVDFGPVRAKMAAAGEGAGGGTGEGPTHASTPPATTPYLSPHLWSLFPDRLDEDEVPEGWVETPLDDVADFLNGLALQKYPASKGDPSLPVVKIAELRAGITAKSNRASLDVAAKYVIDDGDFLFSWSGSLVAKFWTDGRGALNQHLFKVTSDAYPPWFFSQWVLHHLAEFQVIAAGKATTMGHIQRGHLTAAKCLCPGLDLLRAMTEVMEPMVQKTIDNALESRTLAQTRDLLLPRLMSGELRVADAERDVAAVL